MIVQKFPCQLFFFLTRHVLEAHMQAPYRVLCDTVLVGACDT